MTLRLHNAGLFMNSRLPSSRRGRNLHQQLQTLSCLPPWMFLILGNCSWNFPFAYLSFLPSVPYPLQSANWLPFNIISRSGRWMKIKLIWMVFTCCADLLLGFSFFSFGSLLLVVTPAEEPVVSLASSGLVWFCAGTYVCFSLSQYRYCWVSVL